MGRRTILLIAALVVAALGAVLVFLYVNNARSTVLEGQERVTVLVAAAQIEAGTLGSTAAGAGSFTQKDIPKEDLVAGALNSADPIADLVALGTIFPGQQIILPQWGTSTALPAVPVPEGQLALSVSLGDPERVAGFVTPGSQVAIFATGGPAVRLLLADVTVIGVGATTTAQGQGDQEGEQISTAILTLALTQEQAEKVIAAQGKTSDAEYTGLYFALQGEAAELEVAAPGADNGNLFR
jgi:pilus assembly protein CpaB